MKMKATQTPSQTCLICMLLCKLSMPKPLMMQMVERVTPTISEGGTVTDAKLPKMAVFQLQQLPQDGAVCYYIKNNSPLV